MPICKHLKVLAQCPECRPQAQPTGRQYTSVETLMAGEGISKKVAALTRAEKMNTPAKTFGLVRDAVQKINGKGKPKAKKAK